MNAVEAYRKAAVAKFSMTPEQAKAAIVAPEDDKGEWAPQSLAVIYLENEHLPLDYWQRNFLEVCVEWGELAKVGYIECINAAVCAVYE